MDINDRYFDWLVEKIDYGGIKERYFHLLDYLYYKEFTWILEMDENRAADGECLRNEYEWDGRFDGCSCLEMMIALAQRCEHSIMGDPKGIDQTYKWFWDMIENLGLDQYDDNNFSFDLVDDIVFDWLNRNYKYNGEGGLFPLKHPRQDQKEVEIWFQMCAWLNENYEL